MNELSAKMIAVANAIDNVLDTDFSKHYFPLDNERKLKGVVKQFTTDLKELAEKSKEYGTIDTYAKKLELNSENEILKRVKFLVSVFFVIWQGYFHKTHLLDSVNNVVYSDIDSRYKSLVSNCMRKSLQGIPKLDANINFVSWNYDNQLEKAFSLFYKSPLNLSELNDHIRFLPDNKDYFSNNRILHLNGVSNFWIKEDQNLDRIFQSDDEISIESIIRRISEIYRPANFNKCTSLINYAWDDNTSKLQEAKRIFKETDILVIIGYSFPTFNRALDSEFLSGEKNSFDKIIYQDPNANRELLDLFDIKFRNSIGNIVKENGHLKIVNQPEQFYIPPEYFPSSMKTNDDLIGF